MQEDWSKYVENLGRILEKMECTDESGAVVCSGDGFAGWQSAADTVRAKRGRVYFIGNGASASMASHFAADLSKNGRIKTETFCDLSLMTAVSNDINYEQVFAEPLRLRAEPGDMLVAISSSGKSPNVVAAANVARQCGLQIVTLSALSPSNPLRQLGWLNFYVAANTYGFAETAHAAILHHWMDMMQLN